MSSPSVHRLLALILAAGIFVLTGPIVRAASDEVIGKLPLDNTKTLGVRIEPDEEIKREGKASVRIVASRPVTIPLGAIPLKDVENAKLVYEADVRVKGLNETGMVYLEMWVEMPNNRFYFSRGFKSRLSKDTDWTTLNTAFFLRKGHKPTKARLNLVIIGSGTVWVDNLRLKKTPLL